MDAQDALLAAERAKMEAEVRAKAKADEVEAAFAAANANDGVIILEAQAAAAIEERRKQAQIASQLRPVKVERPSDKDIIAAISEKFGVSPGKAMDWILEVAEAMKQAA